MILSLQTDSFLVVFCGSFSGGQVAVFQDNLFRRSPAQRMVIRDIRFGGFAHQIRILRQFRGVRLDVSRHAAHMPAADHRISVGGTILHKQPGPFDLSADKSVRVTLIIIFHKGIHGMAVVQFPINRLSPLRRKERGARPLTVAVVPAGAQRHRIGYAEIFDDEVDVACSDKTPVGCAQVVHRVPVALDI